MNCMCQMNHMYRTLLAAVTLAFSSVAASAETITVCASGCDYTSINAAIGAASDGDVIQLSAETYFEGSQIDTLGKAITLRGVPDKAGEPASVLDGAGSHRVLICESGETSATVFQDLMIKNGNVNVNDNGDGGGGMFNGSSSPTLTNCTFTNNSASGQFNGTGGGVYNSASNPILTDCTFTSNSADYGGGGMVNESSSPALTNCTFTSNSAEYGGGMYNYLESNPTLANCTFEGNSAVDDGGGMLNSSGSPTLTNCTFTSNSAVSSGGGVYNYASNPILTDCTFTSNSADYGGGMYNYSISSPTLAECDFTGNSAIERGGAIFFEENAGSQIDNCVFSLNHAGDAGAGLCFEYLDGSNVVMTACVFTECCQNVPYFFGSDPELMNDLGWPCADCVGDVTCDAMVNAGDLGRLLSAWDTTQQRYDLNEDGIVNAADLGLLLGAWGPCQ
jgi:predicted outer membrane repeat protein